MIGQPGASQACQERSWGRSVKHWAPMIAVGLAVGLPWTTWIQGWSPSHGDAVRGTPLLLLLAGGAAIVCCWVGERDLWLGIFGLYLVVRSAVTLGPPLIEAALCLTAGLALVSAVQGSRSKVQRWAENALALAGALVIGYAAIQWLGYHPLATGLHRIDWAPDGALGNRGYLGGYVAITVAFAPRWAIWWWLMGIVLAHSVVAAAAAGLVLAIRFRRSWQVLPAVFGAAIALGLVLWMRAGEIGPSFWDRMESYRMALQSMHGWAVPLGYGPGSWGILAIPLTNAVGHPSGGYMIPLHSDPLQLLFEGGLIAGLIAGIWLWQNRRAFIFSQAGAGMAGALVYSAAWFPFHVGTLAALSCVVMGLATGECQKSGLRDQNVSTDL